MTGEMVEGELESFELLGVKASSWGNSSGN
jgi:hypothetical protein